MNLKLCEWCGEPALEDHHLCEKCRQAALDYEAGRMQVKPVLQPPRAPEGPRSSARRGLVLVAKALGALVLGTLITALGLSGSCFFLFGFALGPIAFVVSFLLLGGAALLSLLLKKMFESPPKKVQYYEPPKIDDSNPGAASPDDVADKPDGEQT